MTTVTGYALRNAIKSNEMKLEAAQRVFNDSLVKFPSEVKVNPEDAMDLIDALETEIAQLQATQSVYNGLVKVKVLGAEMTLAEAVKRQGGAGRVVSLWKKASGAVTSDRYRRYEEPVYANLDSKAREAGREYAVRTITDMKATENAVKAERFASALRGAIAEGNAVAVDLDLDPSLLAE